MLELVTTTGEPKPEGVSRPTLRTGTAAFAGFGGMSAVGGLSATSAVGSGPARPTSPKPRSVQLGLVGDLILARRVSDALRGGLAPVDMWGDLRPRMLATDAMIGNLEGPITTHPTKWDRWKAFYFRADPLALDALKAGNFKCLALANNHMIDYGAQGMFDTRKHLEAAGIAFAGAGADPDQAMKPALFTAGQVRIGFISITNNIPAFRAKPGRPGTNYWRIRTDRRTIGRLAGLIYDLRQAGAELIILSVHWGPNYRWWPSKRFRAFAMRAIDLGVDIVHGHSAHILQAVEFHGRGIILYDTGDYIDDFIVVRGFRSDYSFLFLIEAGPGLSPTLRMVPAKLSAARVDRATGDDADTIRSDMIRRCHGYAVDIREDDGELVATAPRQPAPERSTAEARSG
jgi:poly-gamma-glutamate capsule biosynthesis protein CapA/YwtB (metallophosphatase superfamily)